MQLTEGEFRGYIPPSSSEVASALAHGPVVVDANVLLGLYRLLPPAREIALGCLRDLGDRLWMPHQVAREYWRNRAKEVHGNRMPTRPLDPARDQIRQQVNRLTPATQSGTEVGELRTGLLRQLDELEKQLTAALGTPIDVDRALFDPMSDPVATAIREIFADRVGERPADEAEMIAEGLRRFKNQQPPGFKDAADKVNQRPEQGTGDYLLWEQSLRYLERAGVASPFVIVTGDEKADWRLLLDKNVLGPHPALVHEAYERLGQPVYIISPTEFYDHLTSQRPLIDPEAVESLIATAESDVTSDWDQTVYEELLARLESEGYYAQAESIRRAAASPDGFVSRRDVYAIGRFDSSRSLRRFSLPARRIMLNLIDEGRLVETADPPLSAQYNGPGPAIGFVVPASFKAFETWGSEPTWIQAAARIAREDPERWWTVSELIDGIREKDLRDTSPARAPEATLRRELELRQVGVFEGNGAGGWRLCVAENVEGGEPLGPLE